MRWCSLQTNEHHLQAIMYPIICKYHRLNINNGNKVPVFPGYICNRWQNMIVQPSQTHNHGKIWQQWEGGYFRFDDDNKMGYGYIHNIGMCHVGLCVGVVILVHCGFKGLIYSGWEIMWLPNGSELALKDMDKIVGDILQRSTQSCGKPIVRKSEKYTL